MHVAVKVAVGSVKAASQALDKAVKVDKAVKAAPVVVRLVLAVAVVIGKVAVEAVTAAAAIAIDPVSVVMVANAVEIAKSDIPSPIAWSLNQKPSRLPMRCKKGTNP